VDADQHADGAAGLDVVDRLAEQLARLADRLRSLSGVRLAAALPSGASRADAAHALAQRLADNAAVLVGDQLRPVPRLDDLATGDEVAVTGTDLVRALRVAARDPATGWQEIAESALADVRLLRDQV
jgi:hypothetical protein